MRTFIVLACLATAYGASLGGYDYERPGAAGFGGDQGGAVGGFNGGSSFGGNGGGFNGGSSFGGNGGGFNGGSSFGGNGGGFNGGSGGFGAGPAGGSGGFGAGPAGGSGGFGAGPAGGSGAPAEFTKEFYSFTAPEGAFDDNSGADQLGNSLKRGLRVIFIKGPENSGLEDAALQLAKSAAGQRTAIYVLNKQADIGDLANKLNNLNHNGANKPEVHFVKYRTPADADNAQRAIQSQYDSLGGKTNTYNGGVAPVLDFASKGPVAGGSPFQVQEPAGSYLPPNKRV